MITDVVNDVLMFLVRVVIVRVFCFAQFPVFLHGVRRSLVHISVYPVCFSESGLVLADFSRVCTIGVKLFLFCAQISVRLFVSLHSLHVFGLSPVGLYCDVSRLVLAGRPLPCA